MKKGENTQKVEEKKSAKNLQKDFLLQEKKKTKNKEAGKTEKLENKKAENARHKKGKEKEGKNLKKSKKEEKIAKKSQKNQKKQQKTEKKEQKGGKGILWFLAVSAVSVSLLFVCQFFLENTLTGQETFYDNTKINGLDVGGMSVAEAENVVLTDMLASCGDIELELVNGGNSWTICGTDFEVTNRIQPLIRQFSKYGRDGNFFQNMKKGKEIEQNGIDFTVSYTNILSSMDNALEEIISQVEREAQAASLVFQPDSEDVFVVDEGQSAILVDREALRKEIDNALLSAKKVTIEIPIIELSEDVDLEELKDSVGLRGSFSTSYAKSSEARKTNVKKALSAFNGMIVQPDEVVSFNETTGARTEEQGYKNAHIIVGGVYVDGVGGGVCQASTTLYNALLLSDIEILSVNHHSLPASYVPLSFDAMVSNGYSDLIFKNTLETPIYIKTSADEENVCVEIYGEKLDAEIKTEAELVKILPHNGDKIVADEKGDYADKILYKGEYLRVKYPREGYESKGYVNYYKDGELVEQKEVRHDFYQPQDGVVMEGVEEPAEGMTIPASDVKIIKPQKVTKESEEAVKNKLKQTNPSEYNP